MVDKRESLFLALEIRLSGRTTHKVIAEVTDKAWLQPEREEELKEALFTIASQVDWTLEGRIPGDLRQVVYSTDKSPTLSPAQKDGLTLWEIIAQ